MATPVLAMLLGGWALAATIGLGLLLARRRAAVQALAACEARLRVVEAESRDQAVRQERERIYADLHDDLGAKLLGLVYQAESPVQADLARAILQDLRDVVTRSRGTPGTLGDVLADIRSEASQRLSAVGIGLAWDADDALPDPVLDSARALHLHRIVRESLSNTIRHAQARQVRVRVTRSMTRSHSRISRRNSASCRVSSSRFAWASGGGTLRRSARAQASRCLVSTSTRSAVCCR